MGIYKLDFGCFSLDPGTGVVTGRARRGRHGPRKAQAAGDSSAPADEFSRENRVYA